MIVLFYSTLKHFSFRQVACLVTVKSSIYLSVRGALAAVQVWKRWAVWNMLHCDTGSHFSAPLLKSNVVSSSSITTKGVL